MSQSAGGSQLITAGTILIEKGTPVPPSLRLESNLYPSAWMSVSENRSAHNLEHELAARGWTFFYMAGDVTASAYGFDSQKVVHKALQQLMAGARLQKFNCLEIDKVAIHWFLGMRYASISAHSCHIQESPFLTGVR